MSKEMTNYTLDSIEIYSFQSEKFPKAPVNIKQTEDIDNIPIEFTDSFDDRSISSIAFWTFPSKSPVMPEVENLKGGNQTMKTNFEPTNIDNFNTDSEMRTNNSYERYHFVPFIFFI